MSSAIETEGLVRTFGKVRALDGIDMVAREGTVFGLLGPNGAGKTTAIRVLSTLIRPDAGRATVGGHDVVREPAKVRSLSGLTGQYAAGDELLSGQENLFMLGRLLRLRTLAGSLTTSWPPTVARPASGRMRVDNTRMAVVFPAPFGPSSPKTVPSAATMSMPSSARTFPNVLTRPSVSIAELMAPPLPFRAANADVTDD